MSTIAKLNSAADRMLASLREVRLEMAKMIRRNEAVRATTEALLAERLTSDELIACAQAGNRAAAAELGRRYQELVLAKGAAS